MEADLDRQLKFPQEIAITSSRPDIVLVEAGRDAGTNCPMGGKDRGGISEKDGQVPTTSGGTEQTDGDPGAYQ